MQRLIFCCVIIVYFLLCSTSMTFGQEEAKGCGASATQNISGELVQVVAHFEDESSEVSYMLRVAGWNYKIEGNLDDANQAVGKKIVVVGQICGTKVVSRKLIFKRDLPTMPQDIGPGEHDLTFNDVLNDDRTENTPVAVLGLPPRTIGVRKVISIFAYLQDQAPMSEAQFATRKQEMQNAFTNNQFSVADYFWDASYTEFSIEVTIHPVQVLVPYTSANCVDNMTNAWTNSIKQQLAAVPAWVEAKTRIINFPTIPGCTKQAIGTVGPKGDPNFTGYAWIQLLDFVMADNWLLYKQLAVHETIHNLGIALHSGGVNTAVNPWFYSDANDKGCIMAGRFRFPNNYVRFALGWFQGRTTVFSGPREQPFQDLPWQVHLVPPGQLSSRLFNPRNTIIIQLKNADGTISDMVLLLEVRKNSAYDAFGIQYETYTNGLSIRIGHWDLGRNSSRPFLLDTTPFSLGMHDDAQLLVGQTFAIPEYGVTLRVVERFGPYSTYKVEILLTR